MLRFMTSLALCAAAASAAAQTTVALDLVDATGATRAVGTVALAAGDKMRGDFHAGVIAAFAGGCERGVVIAYAVARLIAEAIGVHPRRNGASPELAYGWPIRADQALIGDMCFG